MLPMRSFHEQDLLSEAETLNSYLRHFFLSKVLVCQLIHIAVNGNRLHCVYELVVLFTS